MFIRLTVVVSMTGLFACGNAPGGGSGGGSAAVGGGSAATGGGSAAVGGGSAATGGGSSATGGGAAAGGGTAAGDGGATGFLSFDAGPSLWDGGAVVDGGTFIWTSQSKQFSQSAGTRVAGTCPGGTESSFNTVWGTGVYTDDSSICTAAVHSGRLLVGDGGSVVVEVRPGQSAYTGTVRNGVTSRDYGVWGGSFVFVP